MEVLAVEVVMDAFTLLTLEVGQPVHAQHVRVAQEIVRLKVEQRSSALGKRTLQSDQSRHVLMIFS